MSMLLHSYSLASCHIPLNKQVVPTKLRIPLSTVPATWNLDSVPIVEVLALQGQALMAPYLPRDGASGSPYSEGGALYALGLIHTNNGNGIR